MIDPRDEKINVSVQLRGYSTGDDAGSPCAGHVTIRKYSDADLKKRAMKAFGVCILGSVCGFFIHPGGPLIIIACLVAAPLVAGWLLRNPAMVIGGAVTCPKCSASITVANGPLSWPYSDRCEKCFSDLEIFSKQ